MNPKLAIVGVASVIFAMVARADWKTLRSEDGAVVEIVADFQIEAVSIAPTGEATMTVKSTENGDEVGFSVKITEPKKGEMPQLGKDESVHVFRCDLEIRTAGPSTKRLEELLRHRLHGPTRSDSEARLVGLYSAICSGPFASFASPSIFQASDVGLTFDDSGKTIPGDCLAVILVVDAPMKRLTGYFSNPGGYGGTSAAARARSQWYEAKAKKEANHTDSRNTL